MTPRQLEVLKYVEEYRGQTGCAPTLQEIADHLHIAKVTVFGHLKNLEKRKKIRREYYCHRGIEVPNTPRRLPLAGRVSPGKPIESPAATSRAELLAPIQGGRDSFAFEVAGEGWPGERIQSGDFLICERRKKTAAGDLAVVQVAGAAELRRLAPGAPTESIQGIVVGVFRRL